ncbi:nuclear transport factor 2 family protein [Pontimicrobium sp. SW4]|uniref:Nuclear transport factor 2 family protein n=1 Tax=Pontimicrobium sp. SW4 TaxID=3153519 RepID=A0AAU7BW66_9FLAO
MKKTLLLLAIFLGILSANAQTETEKINKPLMDYIEGTANGEPDRLKRAFHPDFNLYFVKNDSVNIWSGKGYISNVKQGKKSNRIGKIVSVDYENDAAIAKIEIDMPDRKRLYTDYLMLLNVKGEWKIIHKSFTFVEY